MNLINPSVEIIKQESGIEGIYKQIELAGRTCYQSQDKITKDSAKGFVDRMIKSGHGAMLEHGTVYLYVEYTSPFADKDYILHSGINYKYSKNKYSKVNHKSIDNYKTECYITTNLRVLVENDWLEDLQYLCEPTEYHEKRVTIKFTTGIDITREFNRHRVNSMAESSTRYCNYSKDKFGNEISIIENVDINAEDLIDYIENKWEHCFNDGFLDQSMMFNEMCLANKDTFGIFDTWVFANLAAEWSYMKLIELGWKPQQARRVLPLDTMSTLVHTAFISDWKHFLSLRSSDYKATGVHPDASYLANKLFKLLENENYLYE
jgi:thymidylate synthase (FAD)